MKTEKYVRKPFYVEAVRVTAENMAEVASWCGGTIEHQLPTNVRPEFDYIKVNVERPTHPRQTMAAIGNWVLRVGTSFKVYTNTSFMSTFDKVSHS